MATLKTFDPPLSALEGRRFAGARRRGKHLLFPTEDGELVLHVHLMSAGRIRFLEPGAKGPKTPAFRLRLEDGGELILTEGGPKKRAKVGCLPSGRDRGRARAPRPRGRRHSGGGARRDRSARRPTAPPVPPRPAGARRDRPRLVERDPQPGEALAVRADDRALRRGDRAPGRDDPRADGLRPRAPRSQGAGDAKAYKVHNRLGEPCPNCGTPIAQVDFEEHTIFYCPECQTGRPRSQGPAAVAAAQVDGRGRRLSGTRPTSGRRRRCGARPCPRRRRCPRGTAARGRRRGCSRPGHSGRS